MICMNSHPMLGIPPDTIWCYSMLEHEMWYFHAYTFLSETGENTENIWLLSKERGWFVLLD